MLGSSRKKWRNITMMCFYSALLLVAAFAIFYFGRDTILRPWTARKGAGAAAVAERIYVFGGQDNEQGILDEVLELDIRKRSVHVLLRLPQPVYKPATVSIGSKIYILGGTGQVGYLDQILEIDVRSGEVQLIGTLPTPRAYGGVAVVANQLYYVGGASDTGYLDEIVEVDPESGESRVVGHLPSARQHVATVGAGESLYVFGGEDQNYEYLADVIEYVPTTGALRRNGKLPATSSRMTVTAIDGKLIACGGWRLGKPMDWIIEVDTSTSKLEPKLIGSLKEPVADRELLTIGKRLYMVGGSDPGLTRQIGVLEIAPQSLQMEYERFRLKIF